MAKSDSDTKIVGKCSKLSPRDLRVVELRVAGKSKVDSLIGAGFSRTTAYKGQAPVFNRIEGALAAELERQGLTTEILAEQIREGCKAEKSDGSPEHFARHAYHKLVVSVRGDEAPKQQHITLNVSPEEARRHQNRLAEQFEWLK